MSLIGHGPAVVTPPTLQHSGRPAGSGSRRSEPIVEEIRVTGMRTNAVMAPPVTRTLLVGLAAAAGGAAAVTAGSLAEPTSAAAAPLVYLVGAVLVAHRWRRPTFGIANTITLSRLVGTSWIATVVTAVAVGRWTGHPVEGGLGVAVRLFMVVVGATCLVLDGVDGRMARRYHEASAFGARFDMETDAATVLFLSAAVPVFGAAGWWVLAIGLMRYFHVAASWIFAPLRIHTPGTLAGRLVAVIQGVALLLSLTFGLFAGLPGWLPTVLLMASLAALVWSFGRQSVWQVGQARTAREQLSRATSG
jgi:phosphatidylglycerophosphate synthase